MNYNKLEDVVIHYLDTADRIGIITSGAFDAAVEMILDAIAYTYNEREFQEVLREIRNDHFDAARGESKGLLDNMLYELLDVVSFG